MKKYLVILALPALLMCCRHEPVVPDKPHVSFSGAVLPIIAGNCAESGCHDGVSEFSLLTYEDMMADERIVPWKPYSSSIYKLITTQKIQDVMPPPPKHPLTEEQISTIYLWIEKGAPNN